MRNVTVTVFFYILIFLPGLVLGSEISFEIAPNTKDGDDAVIIDLYLESEGESLNVLEGTIGFLGGEEDAIIDVIVETGGSPFTLWPVTPVYVKEEHVIRFTGGTITAFFGRERVFRMRLFTNSTKELTISWLRGEAYRDDGLGTPVGISSRSLSFLPKKGTPNIISATSDDAVPPVIESIEIGKDEDSFDGKYFLSVYATDALSGISHIEIVENGITSTLTQGSYVFLDQERKNQVLVTVYDKAGNSVSVKVPEEQKIPYSLSLFFLLGIIILMLLLIRSIWIRKGH